MSLLASLQVSFSVISTIVNIVRTLLLMATTILGLYWGGSAFNELYNFCKLVADNSDKQKLNRWTRILSEIENKYI